MNIKRYFVVATLASILVLPTVSFAQSAAEIQAKIEALLAQIQQLQARLDALQKTQTQWCHTFNINISAGSFGSEADALTESLKRENMSSITAFQEKYKDEILIPNGLTHGTGYVGPSTRKKLNQLYGCGSLPPPPGPFYKCTLEAKQCSDGSYVSRTGPKCEFAACPMYTTSYIIYKKDAGWGPCANPNDVCFSKVSLFSDGVLVVQDGDGSYKKNITADSVKSVQEIIRNSNVMHKTCTASIVADYWATYQLTVDYQTKNITFPGCEQELKSVDILIDKIKTRSRCDGLRC